MEEKEDSVFDSYSFGVIADCNTEADWSSVDTVPVIKVSWKVEPVQMDVDDSEDELSHDERAEILVDEAEYAAFKLVKTSELVEERLVELLQLKLEELKEIELEAMIEEEITKKAYEILTTIFEEKGYDELFKTEDRQVEGENSGDVSREESSSVDIDATQDSDTSDDVLIIPTDEAPNSDTTPDDKEIDFFETPDN